MVDIILDTFKDSIVQAPVDGRPKLDCLPSPEDLKYKFLFKVFFLDCNYDGSTNMTVSGEKYTPSGTPGFQSNRSSVQNGTCSGSRNHL